MVKVKTDLPKEKQEALNKIGNLRLLGPCAKYSNNLSDVLKVATNVRASVYATQHACPESHLVLTKS